MKKHCTTLLSILFLSLSLQALAYPPPEKDELGITELEQQVFDYDGKVVEIMVTYASSLEQQSATTYRAYCYYYAGGNYFGGGGASIYFDKDEDALDFFQDLSKKSYGSGKTSFYVLVDGKKFTAIGKKYKKSKGSYSW